MKRIIIGEVKPIKRGQWKDLSIPIYKQSKTKSQPLLVGFVEERRAK